MINKYLRDTDQEFFRVAFNGISLKINDAYAIRNFLYAVSKDTPSMIMEELRNELVVSST